MNRQAMISSLAINLNELSWYIAVPCFWTAICFFWSAKSTSRVKFAQSWRKFSSQTREISMPPCTSGQQAAHSFLWSDHGERSAMHTALQNCGWCRQSNEIRCLVFGSNAAGERGTSPSRISIHLPHLRKNQWHHVDEVLDLPDRRQTIESLDLPTNSSSPFLVVHEYVPSPLGKSSTQQKLCENTMESLPGESGDEHRRPNSQESRSQAFLEAPSLQEISHRCHWASLRYHRNDTHVWPKACRVLVGPQSVVSSFSESLFAEQHKHWTLRRHMAP